MLASSIGTGQDPKISHEPKWWKWSQGELHPPPTIYVVGCWMELGSLPSKVLRKFSKINLSFLSPNLQKPKKGLGQTHKSPVPPKWCELLSLSDNAHSWKQLSQYVPKSSPECLPNSCKSPQKNTFYSLPLSLHKFISLLPLSRISQKTRCNAQSERNGSSKSLPHSPTNSLQNLRLCVGKIPRNPLELQQSIADLKHTSQKWFAKQLLSKS